MSETTYDVCGIGNAIVDVLSRVEDQFVAQRGLRRGTMALIDAAQAETLYAELPRERERSGGSAANTMVGIASLGGRAAFLGKVADDEAGRLFRRDIREAGVAYDTPLLSGSVPTGRCLVLVTPDGERTMQTYLGACILFGPDDVDARTVSASAVTYLEGYLWDPPPAKEALLRAARLAHDAGRKVALSLSDPFCVERHREEFRQLIEEHVDLLFGNEEEIVSLYGVGDFDEAVGRLGSTCEVAALTRGARGCAVVVDGERIDVPAAEVESVVDTTGAGDLFAAGFLFGITRGDEPVVAARIGGMAAAEVISHLGARPERPLADLLRVR
jgi:sugar/nucleoside kinase (ribokinase family)